MRNSWTSYKRNFSNLKIVTTNSLLNCKEKDQRAESLSFVETKRQTYLPRRLKCQPMAYALKGTKSLEGERVQLGALTKAKEALEETLAQRQKLVHQTHKERAHVQSLIKFKESINRALIEEERKATLLAKQCEEELPALQRQLRKVEGVNEFLRREVMGYEVSTAFQNWFSIFQMFNVFRCSIDFWCQQWKQTATKFCILLVQKQNFPTCPIWYTQNKINYSTKGA